MKIVDRLDLLNGWNRLWLVATFCLCFIAFIIFLGDPAIYDSTSLIGSDADQWLASNRAEWGWRCIPGTFHVEINAWSPVSFRCYSMFIDGVPAIFGSLFVGLVSYLVLRIIQWVARGFLSGRP